MGSWSTIVMGLVCAAGACAGGAHRPDLPTDSDVVEDVCDPVRGLPPRPACTSDRPCTDRNADPITTPSDVPTCRTRRVDDHPLFDDGPPVERVDEDTHRRYACLYDPGASDAAGPRPLVVFLHGGSGTADDVYNATLLRIKAEYWPMSREPGRLGFVLLAVQSRNVHYPFGMLADGRHQDSLHWAVATNPDTQNLDAWIDKLVAEGRADPRQIYVAGWSEGLKLAALYGLERHERPTPGGHYVSAIAGYSATSPFDRDALDGERCIREDLPQSTLPLHAISRACDTAPCDEAQRDSLRDQEGLLDDIISVETYQGQLKGQVGARVSWALIDDSGHGADACDPVCGPYRALRNHLVWPDGQRDASGVDHEERLLTFLSGHTR